MELIANRTYTPDDLTAVMGPHYRSILYMMEQMPILRNTIDRRPDGTVSFDPVFAGYYNTMPAEQLERIQAIARMDF